VVSQSLEELRRKDVQSFSSDSGDSKTSKRQMRHCDHLAMMTSHPAIRPGEIYRGHDVVLGV
jgi:hypothetical protein